MLLETSTAGRREVVLLDKAWDDTQHGQLFVNFDSSSGTVRLCVPNQNLASLSRCKDQDSRLTRLEQLT